MDFDLDELDIPDNMLGRTASYEVWESACHRCDWVSPRHDDRNDSVADLAAHTRQEHPE